MRQYLFTSEAVSKGHPDKVADQISDTILDEFLKKDPKAHVAVETMVTQGQVFIAGEVKSDTYVDIQAAARKAITNAGYTDPRLGFDANNVGIINSIHEQSPDIDQGVERKNEEQGAGDQGMMIGYATNETPELMPITIQMAKDIIRCLEYQKECGRMTYLRPDMKTQVTAIYEDRKVVGIKAIVISVSHDEDTDVQTIYDDIIRYVMPSIGTEYPILQENFPDLYVNPTGRFVNCGPAADTGLTGRKIIVDTYGSWGGHGGGAFSGKDPSKVDRSGALAARWLAKNIVASGIADHCLTQISYAIGIAEPVNIYVETFGTLNAKGKEDADIVDLITNNINLTPAGIINRFQLLRPFYRLTAEMGPFGSKYAMPWEEIDLDFQKLLKNLAKE